MAILMSVLSYYTRHQRHPHNTWHWVQDPDVAEPIQIVRGYMDAS